MKPIRSRLSSVRSVIRYLAGIVLVAALVGYIFLVRYQANAPRSQAISTLSKIDHALTTTDPAKLAALIELPTSVAARSSAEKTRWIIEVLRNEISSEGLVELRHHARFGPLLEIFPTEATRWASAANLPANECVAFRLERAGIRAEVVLHQSPAGLRVLRCNNVKQMAPAAPSKT